VTEVTTYNGPLAHLQGSCVPRLFGLFGSIQNSTEVWMAVMEYVGRPLPFNLRSDGRVR
jgi:hypothetical protein